jgi:hypothetical protein
MSVQPPAFAPSDHSNRPPPLRTTSTDHLRSSPPPLLNNTDPSAELHHHGSSPPLLPTAPSPRIIPTAPPHRSSPPILPTDPHHLSSLLLPRSSPPPLTTTDPDHHTPTQRSPRLPTASHRSSLLPNISYFVSPSDRCVHRFDALSTCSSCHMHLHASQYFLDYLSDVFTTATRFFRIA